MPHEITWEKHGVVIHLTGYVNDETLFSMVTDLQGNPYFDELHYVVADYSRCTTFSVTPGGLEYVIATSAGSALSNNKIKVAIVSAAPEIVAAVHQFVTSPITVFPVRTFRTLEAACKWLGIQNR